MKMKACRCVKEGAGGFELCSASVADVVIVKMKVSEVYPEEGDLSMQ